MLASLPCNLRSDLSEIVVALQYSQVISVGDCELVILQLGPSIVRLNCAAVWH